MRVNATTDVNDVGVADLVVVLVKSFHTAEAMAGATALLGPQTLVLSLQNGLGHEDILAEVAGRERVLAGNSPSSSRGPRSGARLTFRCAQVPSWV